MDALEIQRFTSKLVNDPHHRTATAHITDTLDSTVDDMANKYDLVDALDRVTQDRRGDKNASRIRTVLDGPNRGRGFAGETGTKDGKNSQSHRDYLQERAELIAREDSLSWEFLCKRDASLLEKKADRILQEVRKHDQTHIFDTHPSRRGYRGQEHPRFQGDHFLYNSDLINQTILFQIASRMPKGAHLHIHFNANLLPHVLIDIAKGMERMFITSDIPLVTLGRRNSDPGYYDNFNRSRIRFKMLSETEERRTGTGNLFDPNYPPDHKKPMSFRSFLVEFGKHYSQCTVDEWLIDKLVFHEEEAHGWLQTADGAWDRFNARTQMMKGLFNYETAYREYTRRCLQDFADDGIQYAEIRVNFMGTNQLLKDNGEPLEPAVAGETANEQILKIIIDECTKFKAKYTHTKYRDPNSRDLFKDYKGQYLEGIKVIYCTPRSFEPEAVKLLLDECRQFKIKYPQWIAGFDLVGEESKGRPLRDFIPQLLAFREECLHPRKKNSKKAPSKDSDRYLDVPVDIPFLFHCGETLEMGDETPDGNLYDALLLGAKRIGHGYALARHPYVMEQMKRANVCIELCPISNEILGLTPRVNGHAMYNLLANNVHCTVNTDNGTLFKSRLSHDFYQVFVGKQDMTLHGWKQLALWSIEHSCMDAEEQARVLTRWKQLWHEFCLWIIQEYSYILDDSKLHEDH